MQSPASSPDVLVLFQTGGGANWDLLSVFAAALLPECASPAAAALQECSPVWCCLSVSTWLFVVLVREFICLFCLFVCSCEDRNRKDLLDDASFQGHSFVLSCCGNVNWN